MDPSEGVISALKDRNIPLKRDEITAALNDSLSGAKNAEWVQEHLTPDTLLSEEELRLYSKLESSGSLPALFSDTNFDSTRPFLDEDLQNAIEALNTSTAETQRQADLLTLQCDILDRQHKRDQGRESRRNREVERLRRKHDVGRQNASVAVSKLAHELKVSLKDESENSTLDGKKILSALTTRLKENDTLLLDLEGLAAGVKSSDSDASIMKRTSELSTVLAQYVAEEIYCRLDRMYLEKILDARKAAFSSGKDAETAAGLEQEMESLYSEIDILAEMSTKQQFVEPILRQLQNHHGQLRIASHQKYDLILETITEMTTSAESLITSLQDRESFCTTLETFASTYRSEVGEQVLNSTSSRRETMRRFSAQPALMATQPGKQSGPFPESDSLSGLLRRLGLSFEAVFKAEETDGGSQSLIQERQRMLDDLHNYGIASDSPLAAELLPTDRATRLLSSSLKADSLFSASLASVEHEESLTELESKLSRIQTGIQKINQDVIYQRDKNQERFLERWG
ncbi:uncharacterized protein BDV17DRAFT_294019 [Aspergillus undulatus]|uniref:uncharacterized protein n=1 Tax=Aspergillus undulatus TaxID=1810928 RepID=UPI003CCE4C3D